MRSSELPEERVQSFVADGLGQNVNDCKIELSRIN